MISLAGLSAVPEAYNAAQADQYKLDAAARQQQAQRVMGQVLQAIVARQAQGARPGAPAAPAAVAAPLSPMQQRFSDAFAGTADARPQDTPKPAAPAVSLPSMDGIRPGSLTWDRVVNAIAQKNPGIAPDVLAEAVGQFEPLMTRDSAEKWKQVQADQFNRTAAQRDRQLALSADKASGAGKPLLRGAVNDLGSAGESFTNLSRLKDSWKPEYGGAFGGMLGATGGDLANTVARFTGMGNTEAANWWQDYQMQQNQTRHALFGSALTATEKSEWEKATINPGMKPDLIEKNLQRQYDVAKRAAKKLADVYVAQGHPAAEVEAAVGFPLSDLGIGEPPASAGAAAPPAAGGPPKPGDLQDGYRFKGGDPADQKNWELVS